MKTNISDRAYIAGVGETEYVRGTQKSERQLILEASAAACRDAGVSPHDVDGVILAWKDVPTNEDVIAALGIKDLKFHSHVHIGGASATAAIVQAAAAISAGLASRIIVATGHNFFSTTNRLSSVNQAPGGIGNIPGREIRSNIEYPSGILAPVQWYSLHANRWFHEKSPDPEGMEIVALTMRQHAHLNDKAYMKDRPLTSQQYRDSPYLVKPFRLFDICLETDGAAAVLVMSADEALKLGSRSIAIGGGAEGHPDSPDDIINRPDILNLGITKATARAFDMAGVGRDDIDFAQIYDCFTFIVLRQLEEMGFCARGEGPDFVKGGRISIGGDFPINTHGGLMSQAHVLGMNHVIEAVNQLRGEAGRAQLADPHIGLVTGYGDFGDGSIVILHN